MPAKIVSKISAPFYLESESLSTFGIFRFAFFSTLEAIFSSSPRSSISSSPSADCRLCLEDSAGQEEIVVGASSPRHFESYCEFGYSLLLFFLAASQRRWAGEKNSTIDLGLNSMVCCSIDFPIVLF